MCAPRWLPELWTRGAAQPGGAGKAFRGGCRGRVVSGRASPPPSLKAGIPASSRRLVCIPSGSPSVLPKKGMDVLHFNSMILHCRDPTARRVKDAWYPESETRAWGAGWGGLGVTRGRPGAGGDARAGT